MGSVIIFMGSDSSEGKGFCIFLHFLVTSTPRKIALMGVETQKCDTVLNTVRFPYLLHVCLFGGCCLGVFFGTKLEIFTKTEKEITCEICCVI